MYKLFLHFIPDDAMISISVMYSLISFKVTVAERIYDITKLATDVGSNQILVVHVYVQNMYTIPCIPYQTLADQSYIYTFNVYHLDF